MLVLLSKVVQFRISVFGTADGIWRQVHAGTQMQTGIAGEESMFLN